jgi:hypothetical protein
LSLGKLFAQCCSAAGWRCFPQVRSTLFKQLSIFSQLSRVCVLENVLGSVAVQCTRMAMHFVVLPFLPQPSRVLFLECFSHGGGVVHSLASTSSTRPCSQRTVSTTAIEPLVDMGVKSSNGLPWVRKCTATPNYPILPLEPIDFLQEGWR